MGTPAEGGGSAPLFLMAASLMSPLRVSRSKEHLVSSAVTELVVSGSRKC